MGNSAEEYLKEAGLSALDWKDYEDTDIAIGYYLLLVNSVSWTGTRYIEFAKWDGLWMSLDDIGWSGPVKQVEKYCKIAPDMK